MGVIQHAGHKRTSQGPLGNKLNAAQADLARPSSTQSVATQFGKECSITELQFYPCQYWEVKQQLLPMIIL